MRKYHEKRATRIVLMAVATAFISLLATASPAQRRLRVPRNPENPEVLEATRQRETLERSSALERVGSEMSTAPTEGQLTPRQQRMILLAQIREDLGRIQDLHEQMVNIATDDQTLNSKRLSETTEEIKKRASRLKNNLALPEPEEHETNRKTQVPQDPAQLRASVSTLSNLITDFVTNPLFGDSHVIDAQLSTKANQDLERIIQLSGTIKKSVERIQKTTKQSK